VQERRLNLHRGLAAGAGGTSGQQHAASRESSDGSRRTYPGEHRCAHEVSFSRGLQLLTLQAITYFSDTTQPFVTQQAVCVVRVGEYEACWRRTRRRTGGELLLKMPARALRSAGRADLLASALAAARNELGLLRDAEMLTGSGSTARTYSLAALAVDERGKALCLTALAVLLSLTEAEQLVANMYAPVHAYLSWAPRPRFPT